MTLFSNATGVRWTSDEIDSHYTAITFYIATEEKSYITKIIFLLCKTVFMGNFIPSLGGTTNSETDAKSKIKEMDLKIKVLKDEQNKIEKQKLQLLKDKQKETDEKKKKRNSEKTNNRGQKINISAKHVLVKP